MRHVKGYRKLGRETSHRNAMLRNLATSFLENGKLSTTVTRAKEVRRMVEKMITLGKRGDLHARRQVEATLYSSDTCKRVFTDLATRFKDRPGGYTRIIKLGERKGDGAPMVNLELVDYRENDLKK
jgi:large subunit ribosomal protein L17